jgi:hypothetical protein
MKKLSRDEINVIINEVNSKVSEIEKLECEKLLSNNSNFSELKELVSNLNEINNKVNELREVINEKCNKLSKELNINLYLFNRNGCENYKINYNKKIVNSFSNYNKLYNKLILKNISSMLNIEELINSLVKEYND